MNPEKIDRPVYLSLVIPLKNEAENIPPLAEEVTKALGTQAWSWECLWVDDGSTDDSLARLKALSEEDPRHRYISFEANAGQSAAFFAGFREANGDVIATIDADRQNDPADLPRLVEMIRTQGWDMVNGYRATRRDNLVRKLASRIGNSVRTLLTGKTVRDVGCSTRAFKKECAASLPEFKGMHRFLPTLVAMRGFRITETAVNHRPRGEGVSKYGTWNRMWVGLADSFGVLWLRKRQFRYRIRQSSAPERHEGLRNPLR